MEADIMLANYYYYFFFQWSQCRSGLFCGGNIEDLFWSA